MANFTIQPNQSLSQQIEAFYHSPYYGGQSQVVGGIENMICTLKNDITVREGNNPDLLNAASNLKNILTRDLQLINSQIDSDLTVCVVPRAKVAYLPHQLLFKEVVKKVVNQLGLEDGTDFIIRIQNTRTTHRDRAGYGGDGPRPYPGITKDTCNISNDVAGKTILLIDDVYTPGIDIDEDAIQALLDKGAVRVFFYAVGHTF